MDRLPGAELIDALLAAGADPSLPAGEGRGAQSAVHQALAGGHSRLALRLLEAVPQARRARLLEAAAGPRRRTLLQMAVEAADAPLAALLLKQVGWAAGGDGGLRVAGPGDLHVGKLGFQAEAPKIAHIFYVPAICAPAAQGARALTKPASASPLVLALRLRAAAEEEAAEAAVAAPGEAVAAPAAEQQAPVAKAAEQPQTAAGSSEAAQAPGDEQQPGAAQAASAGGEHREQQRQHRAAARRAKAAAAICADLLRGWRAEQTVELLEAELPPAERALVTACVAQHAAAMLAPLTQVRAAGGGR